MANDELYTPKHIFDALNVVFDLDVCAPIGGPVYTPSVEYFDIHSDGLTARWFGRVWMNPPFSLPRPWVDKWLEHGDGIALLPLSGNSRWWRKLWHSEAGVLMIEPNTGFINTEGEEKKIMYGISLWGIRDHNIEAMKKSGLGHVR